MSAEQQEALKKISNTGTVMIIAGVFGIFYAMVVGLMSLVFFIAPPSSTSSYSSSSDAVAAVVFGVVFLVLALVSLVFAIVNIIAGVKLRKPSVKSKGWVIYSIVAGVLIILAGGLPGWVVGILVVVFATMALGSFGILADKPTAITSHNKK